MSKKRSYYTASKKTKIAVAAIEGKLTQAQLDRSGDLEQKSGKIRAIPTLLV